MSTRWKGIHKLQEEMGELQQILAKLCVCPGGDHWDGDLVLRLWNEYADVAAAMTYFSAHNANGIEISHVRERTLDKVSQFEKWDLTGV